MFGSDDDDSEKTIFDIAGEMKAKIGRSQDDECDFCGSSEGSVIVARQERHPDVDDAPPVVRCKTCYNNPDTYSDS